MVSIKSKSEIEIMKKSGAILIAVLKKLEESIRPGMTTKQLDEIAEKLILSRGAIPSFKGYQMSGVIDFPASICTSVNEQVVHGIPDQTQLQDGDIISVDVGVYYEGFHTDAARTWGVGEISAQAKQIMAVAEASFFEGIKQAVPDHRIDDISGAIEDYVHKNGFSIVTDLTGHGIGKKLHEDPSIPNFRSKYKGPRLRAGMALAIEPMINAGTSRVKTKQNGWTVVTNDGKLSSHYENTIIVMDGAPLIVTLEES
ncbi:MAG: type I methionyl aminopeptidase [Clostridia bacterium]